jgi:hypothetical protein
LKSYLSSQPFKTRWKADFLRIAIVPLHVFNGGVTLKKGKCVGINENEFSLKAGDMVFGLPRHQEFFSVCATKTPGLFWFVLP